MAGRKRGLIKAENGGAFDRTHILHERYLKEMVEQRLFERVHPENPGEKMFDGR